MRPSPAVSFITRRSSSNATARLQQTQLHLHIKRAKYVIYMPFFIRLRLCCRAFSTLSRSLLPNTAFPPSPRFSRPRSDRDLTRGILAIRERRRRRRRPSLHSSLVLLVSLFSAQKCIRVSREKEGAAGPSQKALNMA